MGITDPLLRALEASGYNAKPSCLRQGTILFVTEGDHEPTEEELDALWIATFGHDGRSGCPERRLDGSGATSRQSGSPGL